MTYVPPEMTERKPKKRRKKSPRQLAIKAADDLFAEVVRSRGRCELHTAKACSGAGEQCCHGISRSYTALRWSLENAFAGCKACHMFFTTHPVEWEIWLRGRWGDERYEHLQRVAIAGAKWSESELRGLAGEFRAMLDAT